jgi:hypothetical protein
MIFNVERKFAFVHIQKTGGISMETVLCKIPGTTKTNQHEFLDRLEDPGSYFKFGFVRNPFDRLVSWYNMGIRKGPINTFWKYILNNSNNFSEFLDCREEIVESGEITPYLKSIAFNQVDYLVDSFGNMPDFIGRYENISDDFNLLMSRLSLKNALPHLNKFEHADYRTFYKPRDVDKVEKLYERDISYFNYKFD